MKLVAFFVFVCVAHAELAPANTAVSMLHTELTAGATTAVATLQLKQSDGSLYLGQGTIGLSADGPASPSLTIEYNGEGSYAVTMMATFAGVYPFSLTVNDVHVDIPDVTVNGASYNAAKTDVITTRCGAGGECSFTLSIKDQFGNPTQPPTAPVALVNGDVATATAGGVGVYTVHFTAPTTAGEYACSVTVEGNAIFSGSLTVLSMESWSSAQISGPTVAVYQNEQTYSTDTWQSYFIVSLSDAHGNLLSSEWQCAAKATSGCRAVSVTVSGPTAVDVTVSGQEDGTWRVDYTTSGPGMYSFSVHADGMELAAFGSPVRLDIDASGEFISAAVASHTLSAPESVLCGEQFTIEATFDNVGTGSGYSPFLDLVVPSSISLGAMVFQGMTVAPACVSLPASGCVNHPYAQVSLGNAAMVCGDGRERELCSYLLPLVSYSVAAPALDLEVSATMTCPVEEVDLIGSTVACYGRGGFRFGATSVDPVSLINLGNSDVTTWSLFAILVSFLRVEVELPKRICTGACHPKEIEVAVTIASGFSVDGLDIIIDMPTNVAFLEVANVGTGAALTQGPSTGVASADARVVVSFSPAEGETQLSTIASFFAPRLDAAGVPVLDPYTAAAISTEFSITVSAGRSGSTTVVPLTRSTTLAALCPSKSVAVIGGGDVNPSDELVWSLKLETSEYFSFGNISITDIMADGLDFNSNVNLAYEETSSLVPTIVDSSMIGNDADPSTDGSTGLTMDVSTPLTPHSALGILQHCQLAVVTYDAAIREDYRDTYSRRVPGDTSVDQTDELINAYSVDVTVRMEGAFAVIVGALVGAAQASVTVTPGSLSVSVYATQGIPCAAQPCVSPVLNVLDTTTVRLTYTLPSSDFEELTLSLFPPTPAIDTSEISSTFIVVEGAGVPSPGECKWGPANTFFGSRFPDSGISPEMEVSGGNSAVTFSFGTYDDPTTPSTVIDILCTVTTTNAYTGDMVGHMWLASSVESDYAQNAVTSMEIRQPILTSFSKAIVSCSNPNAVINEPWGSNFVAVACSPDVRLVTPITSGQTGGLTGFDAGDYVVFSLVAENTGRGDAFDVVVKDVLNDCFEVPSCGIDLQVTNGNGTPATYSGSLFAGGITVAVIPGVESEPGDNVIVVTYLLKTKDDIGVMDSCDSPSAALLQSYKNTPSLPEKASVQVSSAPPEVLQQQPRVTVSEVSTCLSDTEASKFTSATDLAIGEEATWTAELTFPDGISLINAFNVGVPSKMRVISAAITSISAALSFSSGVEVGTNLAIDGNSLSIDLGVVTNVPNEGADEDAVIITFVGEPLDATNVKNGNSLSLHFDLTFGGPSAASSTLAFDVVEPKAAVTKFADPWIADAGDRVRLYSQLRQLGATKAPAYNVRMMDPLPAEFHIEETTISTDRGTAFLEGNSVVTVVDVLLPGERVRTEYYGILTTDVPAAGRVGSTVEATFSSGTEECGENLRQYSKSTYGYVSVHQPTIFALATDECLSADAGLAMGEDATFKAEIALPEGTTSDIVVAAAAHPTLEVYAGRIALGSNVACSAQSTEVTPSGAVFLFGAECVNAADNTESGADKIILEVDAVATSGGDGATADVDWTMTHDGQSLSDVSSNEIVYPALVMSQTSTASADAGDVVTLSMLLQHSSASTAAAQDVAVGIELPAEFVMVPGSLSTSAGSVAGGEAVVVVGVLPTEASVTVSFNAVLQQNAVYGQTVNVFYTTTYNTSAGCHGLPEELVATHTETPFVVAKPKLEIALSPVCSDLTSSGAVILGEEATYIVTAVLPEGTSPDTTVVVDLSAASINAAAATVLSASVETVGGNIVLTSSPVVTLAHHEVTFDLGTVVNTADDVMTPEDHVVFVINVVVLKNGDALTATATYQHAHDAALTVALHIIDVTSPVLELHDSTIPAAPMPQSSMVWVLTVAHHPSSSVDAHAVGAVVDLGDLKDELLEVNTESTWVSTRYDGETGLYTLAGMSLAVGESYTLSLNFSFTNDKSFGSSVSLNVDMRWSSMHVNSSCGSAVELSAQAVPISVLGDSVSEKISFGCRDFATIDNHEASDSTVSGQVGAYELPLGWVIADNSAETHAALACHPFGTACLALSDGSSISNDLTVCERTGQISSATVAGKTVHSTTGVDTRILITREDPFCSPVANSGMDLQFGSPPQLTFWEAVGDAYTISSVSAGSSSAEISGTGGIRQSHMLTDKHLLRYGFHVTASVLGAGSTVLIDVELTYAKGDVVVITSEEHTGGVEWADVVLTVLPRPCLSVEVATTVRGSGTFYIDQVVVSPVIPSNMLLDPEIATGAPWQALDDGFVVATEDYEDGPTGSILLSSTAKDSRGAGQRVLFSRGTTQFYVSARSKFASAAANPLDRPSRLYSVWMDLAHEDGTFTHGRTMRFDPTVTEWSHEEAIVGSDKPLEYANVYALLRGVDGTALFDHFSLFCVGDMNLVQGPSFEEPGESAWASSGGGYTRVPGGMSGSYGARVGVGGGLEQQFDFYTHDRVSGISVSVSARTSDSATAPSLVVDLYGADWVESQSVSFVPVAGSEWQRSDGIVRSSGGIVERVVLRLLGPDAGNVVYDVVSLSASDDNCEIPAVATVYGDPHYRTFDGVAYDMQGIGEYVLIDDGVVEVQVRHLPAGRAAIATALAFSDDTTTVTLKCADGTNLPQLFVGDSVMSYNEGSQRLPGSVILRVSGHVDSGLEFKFRLKQRSIKVVVFVSSYGVQFMTVQPSIPRSTNTVGLLGSPNGNPSDDLRSRTGRVFSVEDTAGIHGEFGDSWRVTAESSLFHYALGTSAATFEDRTFVSATLGDYSENDQATAWDVCQAMGVEAHVFHACMFDVLAAGESFAQSYQLTAPLVRSDSNGISEDPPHIPPRPVTEGAQEEEGAGDDSAKGGMNAFVLVGIALLFALIIGLVIFAAMKFKNRPAQDIEGGAIKAKSFVNLSLSRNSFRQSSYSHLPGPENTQLVEEDGIPSDAETEENESAGEVELQPRAKV